MLKSLIKSVISELIPYITKKVLLYSLEEMEDAYMIERCGNLNRHYLYGGLADLSKANLSINNILTMMSKHTEKRLEDKYMTRKAFERCTEDKFERLNILYKQYVDVFRDELINLLQEQGQYYIDGTLLNGLEVKCLKITIGKVKQLSLNEIQEYISHYDGRKTFKTSDEARIYIKKLEKVD